MNNPSNLPSTIAGAITANQQLGAGGEVYGAWWEGAAAGVPMVAATPTVIGVIQTNNSYGPMLIEVKNVDTTASAHAAALKAEADEMASMKLVVDTFRKLLLVLFAQSPAVLATFGLTPPKPRVVPVATKAKAASQGAAKRKAKTAAVATIDAGIPAPAATPAAQPAATPVVAPAVKPAS